MHMYRRLLLLLPPELPLQMLLPPELLLQELPLRVLQLLLLLLLELLLLCATASQKCCYHCYTENGT